jgi:hypothetical protein
MFLAVRINISSAGLDAAGVRLVGVTGYYLLLFAIIVFAMNLPKNTIIAII